jgi:hypothetical protein
MDEPFSVVVILFIIFLFVGIFLYALCYKHVTQDERVDRIPAAGRSAQRTTRRQASAPPALVTNVSTRRNAVTTPPVSVITVSSVDLPPSYDELFSSDRDKVVAIPPAVTAVSRV